MMMNCNEFKKKVVDLFDKTIDSQTQKECYEHIANCPECKAYYDELCEAFHMLQPQEANSSSIKEKEVIHKLKEKHKNPHRFWHYIAAAAIFLLGFIIGWNRLFSTPAVAEDARINFLQQRIQSVQNVGSFQMEAYVRTTPQENFAYFNPSMPFVKTDIQLLRQNDSVFYRIEKHNGRTVVSDGNALYLWIPEKLYLKGGRGANFLEHFANLIFPERLLAMQKSAIELSKENKVTQTETDSTVVLTIEGTEKNNDLQQLLKTGEMGDCQVIVENTFSKNDGLLRFVKLWVNKDGTKIMLLHIDNIHYNVMLNKSDIIKLPDAEWTNIVQQQPTTNTRLSQLQNETYQQAAERILNAIINGNESQASEALIYYHSVFPALHQKMKNCKVSNFEIRKSPSSIGYFVFYTLTTPNGQKEQRHISIRNDNEQHIWIVDGGL